MALLRIHQYHIFQKYEKWTEIMTDFFFRYQVNALWQMPVPYIVAQHAPHTNIQLSSLALKKHENKGYANKLMSYHLKTFLVRKKS